MRITLKETLERGLRLNLALRFVWDSTPRWTIASVILMVVQGPLPLASLYLMKLLIDEITEAVGQSASADEMFSRVAGIIALMGLTTLFTQLIGQISGLVKTIQAMLVTEYMHDVIHAQSITVDLEYYENPDYYDKLQRAQREAPTRPLRILQNLMSLGQSAISLVAMGGLLLAFHWVMALVLVITVMPSFFIRLYHSRRIYKWQRSRTEIDRQTNYFSWMMTGDRHAKEVRLFDLGGIFSERFRELVAGLRVERLHIIGQQTVVLFTAQIITTVAIYGAYAFIAHETLNGSISLGSLVMYFQAFQRGQGYLGQLMGGIAALFEDNLFLNDLDEFLHIQPRVTLAENPAPVPAPMQTGIAFEQISFQYPTGKRMALQDVSLHIRPGEKVAFVGENGSGKTTAIKLLCRLYDPTTGRITVDGTDLREIELAGMRREISVILQDYAHYNLSVEENIWFGNVHAPLDRERITAAAIDAGADSVIQRLPDGYQTILGKLFQKGEELSIGEWQKIALARAFLRDAQLIILDEPTSAMDARAEYEIFSKLRDLTAGRAVILISHRFSTVRMADTIYVFNQGRIIEHGSHEDLMTLNGTYARLFETQAQHYR